MTKDNSDNIIPFIPKIKLESQKVDEEIDDIFEMSPRAMALILASQHADFLGITGKARELFVWAVYYKYIETSKSLGRVDDWPQQAKKVIMEMEKND